MRLLILSAFCAVFIMKSAMVVSLGMASDLEETAVTDHTMNAATDTGSRSDTISWRPAEVYPATREYKGPDFELPGIESETVTLHEFRGNVVVLNIWATWCPPCRDEVPALIRLQDTFGDAGLQVIGVSVDENGAEAAVRAFSQEFGVNYPVPLDDGTVQELYGPLSVIPTTYIFDADGYIRFYVPGYMEYDQMEEAVKELMER